MEPEPELPEADPPPPPPWRAALDSLRAELESREELNRDEVVANLVTAVEIAEEYGWSSPSTLHTYLARGMDFPAPVRRFGRIDVWWKPSVEAWVKRTPGRVRGAAS
jgi:predicted DNA-binding transcriptional regulator AlpA